MVTVHILTSHTSVAVPCNYCEPAASHAFMDREGPGEINRRFELVFRWTSDDCRCSYLCLYVSLVGGGLSKTSGGGGVLTTVCVVCLYVCLYVCLLVSAVVG